MFSGISHVPRFLEEMTFFIPLSFQLTVWSNLLPGCALKLPGPLLPAPSALNVLAPGTSAHCTFACVSSPKHLSEAYPRHPS